MPTVTPLGDKLRHLRVAHGLKQLELALRAGVSERTVRSAEKGVPIRYDLLEFLAIALGVPLHEVSVPSSELNELLRWRKNCQILMDSAKEALLERKPTILLDVAHPNLAIYYFGALRRVESINEMLGEYHGRDGIHQFIENADRFWEKSQTGLITMESPAGSGDTVQLGGYHEFLQDDGQSIWGRYSLIADFDGGALRSLQGIMVPGTPQQ
ncbi:MAG: helix-turn-helix transcriptional regulator [Pirellulales bacterium]|nr:helix-turn-helix transcriptional regulator [Pirellulales bacterium]